MDDTELDAIRAMLRECVASQGLGRVADQVGMSSSGLRQFLGGSNSVESTRSKVQAWSRRHLRGDGRTRQEVLLDDLLETVPAAARPALRREFARLLSTAATRPDAAEAVDSAPAPQIVYIDLRSSS